MSKCTVITQYIFIILVEKYLEKKDVISVYSTHIIKNDTRKANCFIYSFPQVFASSPEQPGMSMYDCPSARFQFRIIYIIAAVCP